LVRILGLALGRLGRSRNMIINEGEVKRKNEPEKD
jgi:predicted nucleotide-binding protein